MMETSLNLDDLLRIHLAEVGWSERQLADRANIPRGTLRNWLRGHVKKPRRWQTIVQAALAMQLDTDQVNRLLTSANHPTVQELWRNTEEDAARELLSFWMQKRKQDAPAAPFQAIPDLPYFIGRDEEVRALKTHLIKEAHATVYVLHGMGGVGKTTLAARLAYECRYHYPDGVLWARVDTSDTMSILRLFADAYGESVDQYTDETTRSQAVRGILAHKRTLIILDNVESSQQVEPLLPPTGACAVLLTTRNRNLRVARGAPHFHIRPFPKETGYGLALFSQLLGESAVQAEQDCYEAIADRLGHLPLAVAIIAGRIAYEPGWTAVATLSQLQETSERLSIVADEDQCIRTSFDFSYAALSTEQQRFFTSLAVFGGDGFSLEAMAAVMDVSLPRAERTSAYLSTLSLLQPGQNGRFRLHPLLRDYAREYMADTAPYKRALQYFISYVEQNQRNLASLDLEFDNILTTLKQAYTFNETQLYVKGITAFSHFLVIRGLYKHAELHLRRAKQIAEDSKDLPNLVKINSRLGQLEIRRGNLELGLTLHNENLPVAQATEEPELIGKALHYLGLAYHQRRDYEKAETYWSAGIQLAQEHNLQKLHCTLLNGLGALALNFKADFQQAETYYREGLRLARQLEDKPTAALLLMNLSFLSYRAGQYQQAKTHLDKSQFIADKIGFRLLQSILCQRQALLTVSYHGAYRQALEQLYTGEKIARELSHPRVLGLILDALGHLSLQLGNSADAHAYLDEAHRLAEKVGEEDLLSDVLQHRALGAGLQKDFSQAEGYIRDALQFARRVHDPWHLCHVQLVQGSLLLAQQRIEIASAVWRDLLSLAQQHRFVALAAFTRLGLAQLALERGDEAEMQSLARESLQGFKEIGHHFRHTVHKWLLNPKQREFLLHCPLE